MGVALLDGFSDIVVDWVDIDGALTNIKDYEKVFVEGNRLGYRGIHSDDLCVLSKTKPTLFKKHDIVLLNDATLWEVKIAHKNGKYTLTKQGTPNRTVSYDEIKKFDSLVLYTTSIIPSNGKLEEWNNKTKEEKLAWIEKNTNVAIGSDAFFPFDDNIARAYRSGVSYIAEPGGSIRDDAVIDCCNKYGIAMAFTGMRLFHH